MQGPEEFVSGMALGVQSLVGHTIGGAAGAVGRIAGTVGKVREIIVIVLVYLLG